MSRTHRKITFTKRDDTRIPDKLSKACALLILLFNTGNIDEAGDKLRVRRQGGYSAADGWIALLVWLHSGAQIGLKTLWNESLSRCNQQVAALAYAITLAGCAFSHA